MFKRSFHSILHPKRIARVFHRRIKPRAHANRNHSSILTIIKRYFFPVCDISTITLSFHSILHAERSAYDFQRRNKPRNTQIAVIHRFWRQLSVISFPFEIFRYLHSLFTPFYMQNVVHMISSAETSPETRKSPSFVDFNDN